MPDLIFPLEDGVTHDSVCQIPPHQRTRQNPVNHQVTGSSSVNWAKANAFDVPASFLQDHKKMLSIARIPAGNVALRLLPLREG